MNHYFTDNVDLPHNRRVIPFRFLGVSFKFNTDSGVFSRNNIDFGSELLLNTVDLNSVGQEALDLGCGYGVLAIGLQKLTGCRMTAIDVNSRAIELTEMNCRLNDVSVKTIINDGLSDIQERFTTIVTNPPIRAGKEVVYRFFAQAAVALLPEGRLWVVIRKKQGAISAAAEIERLFGNCEKMAQKRDYVVLKAEKR